MVCGPEGWDVGCVMGPDSPRSLPAPTPQGVRQSQRGLCRRASPGKPGLSAGLPVGMGTDGDGAVPGVLAQPPAALCLRAASGVSAWLLQRGKGCSGLMKRGMWGGLGVPVSGPVLLWPRTAAAPCCRGERLS